MKLLGRTKSKIPKDKNCENTLHLEIKYSQKLLDHTKQSATDAFKTDSKGVIQKTAEATGDLIGNKIADRITKVSKNYRLLYKLT